MSSDRTKALRRYVLGLSLVALTAPQDPFLRQGCNLVPDVDKTREFKVVNLDGTRQDTSIEHQEAVNYAREAAKAFGIGKNREEPFDASRADRSSEPKVEKFNASTVVSVDSASSKFKAKKGAKQLEFSVTSATVITKGDAATTFDVAIVSGAKLDIEHSSGVALKINSKN